MKRVVVGKTQVQVKSQSQEPLVKIVHSCDIHYAEEVPNPPLGTKLTMTSETLSAEAIVPASKAVELAKDLAEEISYESSQPCLSYDCTNAKCRRWISTLESLREEYKHLQDKEPDYSVHLDLDDWYSGLVHWALDYTKERGLLNDHVFILAFTGDGIYEDDIEELIRWGYIPSEIHGVFSNYLDEETLMEYFCDLKEHYPEVAKFLKEQGYKCDGDEE